MKLGVIIFSKSEGGTDGSVPVLPHTHEVTDTFNLLMSDNVISFLVQENTVVTVITIRTTKSPYQALVKE